MGKCFTEAKNKQLYFKWLKVIHAIPNLGYEKPFASKSLFNLK